VRARGVPNHKNEHTGTGGAHALGNLAYGRTARG
jgi:hypothetical protein